MREWERDGKLHIFSFLFSWRANPSVFIVNLFIENPNGLPHGKPAATEWRYQEGVWVWKLFRWMHSKGSGFFLGGQLY